MINPKGQRKNGNMSLRQTEERDLNNILEIIFNNIPIGIIFCDTNCIIRFINQAYADYLGIDPKEATGKCITDYIPDSRLGIVMESGQPEMGDKCPIEEAKTKGKRTLIVNRIPVTGPGGVIFGAISQSLFGDPCELKEVAERIEHLEKKVTLCKEKIRSALSARYSLEEIRGQSAGIVKAKEHIMHYAKTESPVLILGSTGTGKELFANALHMESTRYKGPFVSINCAAIPQDLLESELFGYAPGAFTGARKEGKMGLIELADKGTLFLDEIGDMPLHAQVKLLRVLEEKIVCRLGSTHPQEVNFRLVAATNRDLKALIREGKFREELYYRLSTMRVIIPLLRERPEDIPMLVHHFLNMLTEREVSCSHDAMDALVRYNWPGNVRELKNVIESALSLCKESILDIRNLPVEITSEVWSIPSEERASSGSELSSFLANNEQKMITEALKGNDWNMVRTAKQLGISRATLYEKTKKYHISRA